MTGLLLALAAALPAAAAPAWTPLPRVVLALYDPRQIPGDVKEIQFLDVHQHVELPLNHLGLVVEYVDVTRPLPDPASRGDVIGALAWFPTQAAFDDPRPACRWLSGMMERGKRVVLLGQLGLYRKAAPSTLDPECAAAVKTLGVSAAGLATVDPLAVAITTATALMGFERRAAVDDPSAPLVRALPGSRAQLRVEIGEGQPPVEPVTLTPRGGVALEPFLFYHNAQIEPHRKAWIVDPFAFFEDAFGVAGRPRPDPYTLSGRRVFMARLDGDGFFNVSENDRRRTAGAEFVAGFLDRMPDTPFTIALISGYYDLALYRDPESLHLSRRAFSRPNVEPASHTHAHPLVWRTLKSSLTIPRYKPSYAMETVGSVRKLEKLLPKGRSIGLLQWSGDCQPPEAAIAAAEDAGLLQMNGGGGRFDSAFPSLSHLFPIGRQAGSRRQIYAPVSNENDFTELWSARYYGYRDVLETFRRSGAPRRVKPVDVYVHFYSAERYASEKALRDVFAWARSQPLIPVFGGRYAAAARDFFRVTLESSGPGAFRILGGPDLRTARFDAVSGTPDMGRSKGVIGWRREGSVLYVALDRSHNREIALSPRETPGVRLEQADFEVDGWTPSRDGVSFEKSGWWDGYCVLAGLRPGARYRVRAGDFDRVLSADANGRLEIAFGFIERGGPATKVTVERS